MGVLWKKNYPPVRGFYLLAGDFGSALISEVTMIVDAGTEEFVIGQIT